MRLVYLSPVPWASFAQRPHKFIHWFHKRTGKPVLWVDPYPTRLPQLSDIKRPRISASPEMHGVTPPWLRVLNPGGLPIEPLPGSGQINALLWKKTIRDIDTFTKKSRVFLAIGKPSSLALEIQKRFHVCPSLYDAMDDFPAFYTGLSRLALLEREKKLVLQAGTVWTSSTALLAKWKGFRNDIRLVPNAMDLAAFPPTPFPVNRSSSRIFGYVGTIASWFDWEFVCTLAASRPHDTVRLIGPVFEGPRKALPGNIELMPACDHKVALEAMTYFDAGLIPFKKNILTASVDPIKYYEYRSLALPVISTDFGEMCTRSDIPGVFICRSAADAPELARSALQFQRDPELALSFAQQNTWEARFNATRLFPL